MEFVIVGGIFTFVLQATGVLEYDQFIPKEIMDSVVGLMEYKRGRSETASTTTRDNLDGPKVIPKTDGIEDL